MKIILPVWLLGFVFIFLSKSTDSKSSVPLSSLGSVAQHSSVQDSEVALNYRLPNDTYPEHYVIKLSTGVDSGERAFQGEVTIDIVVVASTNNIVLHASQIEITRVNIANPSTGETQELSHEYELEREFVTLTNKSGRRFEAGTKWQLTILYQGQLRDDQNGFYLNTYSDENGKDRHVALTHFESTYARYAFPCYDEPAKRANFTITINHSPNFTAISNMPVNEKLSSAGKTVFLTTARIPTYIVAFVVSDFVYTEAIFDGIRHRVYSRSSRKHHHQLPLVSGMLFTNYFAEYYGIEYMLPKIDHVATTQHKSEGMENWGLPIYKENRLLFDKKVYSIVLENIIAKTVAHEVAHHWFGDYVTLQWWNDLWLKEGFATLLSYQAVDHIYPEWNIWQDFHAIDYQRALIDNSFRPLAADVQKPSEMAAIYDDTTYFKAASVLLMWQNALGEEVFRRGLQNFLKNNRYSIVTGNDLFKEMEKSAAVGNLQFPASVNEMMKTWTQQGFYPLLTVTRNYTDGSFTVRQEEFSMTGSVTGNRTWYVPINFLTASNIDFYDTKASHYLPNINEIRVDAELVPNDWIVLNKRSEYFYRIKYDQENYKLITQALIERPFKMHSRNRAQLLDDASALTFSKRLSHGVLLEMMTYLKKEDQYAPWITAENIIRNYSKLKDFTSFRHFIVDLIRPIFNKLFLNAIPGEHRNDKYTRSVIINIACKARLEECLIETNKKLKGHLLQNVTLEPDLHAAIFSSGLIQADDEEFNIVYQRLMDSPDNQKRVLLMFYLSFAQNERHIKKFVSSSIDMSNKLQPTERYNFLKFVYGKSEKSLLACIEFLNDNWHEYGNLTVNGNDSNKPLDTAIRGMAKFVLTDDVNAKFLALVDKVKASKYVSKSLESDVKKTIEQNYEWFWYHGKSALLWISQYMQEKKN